MTDGKRAIEMQIEVSGTPEEVWASIATGPGISSWFVPAQVEEGQGGRMTLSFGTLGDDVSVLETWEPPRRYVAVSEAEHRGTRFAMEFLVEARDGGTCVVRFVQSGFGTGEEWDDEYHETEQGWATFLHNLQLYLSRFRGERGWPLSAVVETPGPRDKVWASLAAGFGLPLELTEGQEVAGTDGPMPVVGTVEQVVLAHGPHVRVLLDEPAPGYALVAVGGNNETAYAHVTAYVFGERAEAIAAEKQPALREWLTDRFS